jgi:hypothetical protein
MRVTPVTNTITPSRRSVASITLSVAAIGLAIVGIIMNGLFARTHGSTDIAGWLFLAFGVVADLTALAMPSCAARLWAARQRAAAAMAWVVWAMAFAYALTEGIGFVSTNIKDVTLDPKTEAAIRVVAWVSGGHLHPTGDDFAMLLLILLALLPQLGGILLMVAMPPDFRRG